VDLPEGLTTIEIQAFAKCTSLQEIQIPSTVQTIGISAFANCTSLVVLNLLPGLKTIGSMAFCQCSSLVSINVPDTVQVIRARAFAKCTHLVEAYLPEGLTRVEGGLFATCIRLERIQIPSTVKVVMREAFSACMSLVQVNFPIGLQTIHALAFWKCFSVKNIDLSPTIKIIASSAFCECTRFTRISLPIALKAIHVECFRNCTSLEWVNVPTSVIEIRTSAFSGCARLVQVNLSEGLRRIGDRAFANCSSLAGIKIPSTVQRIAYEAFSACQSLVCVEIPSSSTLDISDGVFLGCQNLVNICIPTAKSKKYSNVDSWRFHGCSSLQKLFDSWLLIQVLQTRFDHYPVHGKCYHASETTIEELRQEVEAFDWMDDTDLVDCFGMTPFHVLLSSATSRMDLLKVLLEMYPTRVLDWKDKYGRLAEEYLSSMWMDESRPLMQLVLQRRLLDRLSLWGSEVWRMNMVRKIQRFVDAKDKESRNKYVMDLNILMQRYTQIETVVLLELWLWKLRLLSQEKEGGTQSIDRATCRARCGFSFIKPLVCAYLGSSPV